MKIAVQIAGTRNNTPIDVPLSVETDGHLTFQVPSAKPRLAACTFSVDLNELEQAISHLTPGPTGARPRAQARAAGLVDDGPERIPPNET